MDRVSPLSRYSSKTVMNYLGFDSVSSLKAVELHRSILRVPGQRKEFCEYSATQILTGPLMNASRNPLFDGQWP